MWDANPAIFLRSALPIDACQRHLRKFTRLPNESGAIYLFRFWESLWTGALLRSYFNNGLNRIPIIPHTSGQTKNGGRVFPYVNNGKTADHDKAAILSAANAYAGVSGGDWNWRGNGAGYHCKTFQAYLMREARLWKRLGIGVGSYGWSVNT